MSWTTSPGDLEQALARYGPLTDVWEVVTVPSSTTLTVALVQPKGVVPVLGSALAALYTDALVVFVTGALSGAPAVAASPGRFGTTVASVTSAAGPPPVTTLTLADALPATPHAGDQLVVIRNLGVGQALDATIQGDVTATIDTSGGAVDVAVQGDVTVANQTLSVEFPAAQDVNLITAPTIDANIQNAQLDANVINSVLSSNPGVVWPSSTVTDVTIPAGGTTTITVNGSFGLWDAVGFFIQTSAGNMSNYTFWLSGTAYYQFGLDSTLNGNIMNESNPYQMGPANTLIGTTYPFAFTTPQPFDQVILTVKNNSTASVTDTITIVPYLRWASQEVVNAASNPVNAAAPPLDMADASGSITTGGTSQQVLASAASRRYLLIVNATSNSDTLWVNFGSAASAGAGSIPLAPGFALEYPAGQYVPSNTVNLVAATTGDAYTVKYA